MLVAVAATKGGVGKTTTAVSLAHIAQANGVKVKVLDMDPQRHAILWDSQIAVDGTRLTTARQIEDATGEWDLTFIDLPPGADARAIAGIEAATHCLAVCRPATLDIEALAKLVTIVEPTLIVPTQFDKRRQMHAMSLEHLEATYPGRVTVPIPMATSVEWAAAEHNCIPVVTPPAIAYREVWARLTTITSQAAA